MTVHEALKILARRIITSGPSCCDGGSGLVPSGFVPRKERGEFHALSDLLENEFQATHYSVYWVRPGKSVAIKLFASPEGFGGVIDVGPVVHEEVFKISELIE